MQCVDFGMQDPDTTDSVADPSSDTELIYVGDPMCSWCWGFAPEIDRLQILRPDLPLRVVVGGLRPGPAAEPMTDRMAEFLFRHWEEVERRSGQSFDATLLERRDWVYDTETPCRAVVAARTVDTSHAWPVFRRLQRAFYAEGRLVTDPGAYPGVLADVDIAGAAFMRVFEGDDSLRLTWDDFATSRRWGVTGFPTLILRTGQTGQVVAAGYTTADRLDRAIGELLADD